jgi:protein SCO1/2
MTGNPIAPEAIESRFSTDVTELAEVDRVRLVDLCDERNAVYAGQPAAAIVRMRGWVLAALSHANLPDAALPYVLEDLETAHDPYLVSAAAACLRSYPYPHASFAAAVLTALQYSRSSNAPVTLEQYGGIGGGTSPMKEVVGVIEWLGPHAVPLTDELKSIRAAKAAPPELLPKIDNILTALADPPDSCCAGLPETVLKRVRWTASNRNSAGELDSLVLENHAGQQRTYAQWFQGRPTILVFFYTRCDNPRKCSLTLWKLGQVQKLLKERGLIDSIRTAAITYDSAYDTADRLLKYGKDRGLRMDDEHALLRVPAHFDALRRHFELGVNFFESLVVRHRIEVFILDKHGRIASSVTRLNWGEESVVAGAVALLNESTPKLALAPAAGSVAGVLASVMPKCPVCWAAYLSSFGITGVIANPSAPGLRAMAGGLLLLHLTAVLWGVRFTNWRMAHLVSVAGAMALAVQLTLGVPGSAQTGAALIVLGSILTVHLRSTPRRT